MLYTPAVCHSQIITSRSPVDGTDNSLKGIECAPPAIEFFHLCITASLGRHKV